MTFDTTAKNNYVKHDLSDVRVNIIKPLPAIRSDDSFTTSNNNAAFQKAAASYLDSRENPYGENFPKNDQGAMQQNSGSTHNSNYSGNMNQASVGSMHNSMHATNSSNSYYNRAKTDPSSHGSMATNNSDFMQECMRMDSKAHVDIISQFGIPGSQDHPNPHHDPEKYRNYNVGLSKPYYTTAVDNAPSGAKISTQKVDFKNHGTVQRPKNFKPAHQYFQPNVKFNAGSLYKDDFKYSNDYERRVPIKPANHSQEMAQKQNFKPAPPSKLNPVMRPESNRDMQGTFHQNPTSYSTDFNKNSSSNINMKPVKLNNNFEGHTFKPNFGPGSQRMQSTTKEHFAGNYSRPAEICRPRLRVDEPVLGKHNGADSRRYSCGGTTTYREGFGSCKQKVRA